jgi:hypothetical protein
MITQHLNNIKKTPINLFSIYCMGKHRGKKKALGPLRGRTQG